MTDDEEERQKKHRRLWLSLAALVVVLAVLIVPPLVSVSRYKNQITSLIASSLGRPVRISTVSVRLLPRPGFVLDDLTVEDDPAFGAEPVLHASSVAAPIRILSLWRGKLEISKISVDEASVNLVRMPDGRWNLDPLLQTRASKIATAASGDGRSAAPFPYLAATNTRVNFKSGIEKLPFSVVDADLSVWESNPGEWRIRLRGQPLRTDVSLDTGDTGIVELDATARRAPELEQIPVHLDLEWRDAQLGQLSMLVTGSDSGWRGDLRGEIHVDGTADAAQVTTRLRASGVHRVEFAPAAPMDFDANCSLVYHYSRQAVENLVCDSPLGDGHIRVAGDVPGSGVMPHYSVEMDHVPVGAGLDALRTFRSGVDPSLQAAGTVSGKMNYAETAAANAPEKNASVKIAPVKPRRGKSNAAPHGAPAPGPLTGSFTVENLQLSGGGLSRPLQAPKMVLEAAGAAPGNAQALAASVAIPAGGPAPLTVNLRLGLKGYQVTVRGQASILRARDLARAAGFKQATAFESFAGDPLIVDLDAEGPWLPPEESLPGGIEPGGFAAGAVRGVLNSLHSDDNTSRSADTLNATVTLRNANWKADYLANHLQISEATLHVENGGLRWDPIDFTYGPLKGTASLSVPKSCGPPDSCTAQPPNLNIQFGDLDAATLQTALLGAREQGTLLSDLLDRLNPASAPKWPQLNGTIAAHSLLLGPVKLDAATVELHLVPTGAEIASFDAKLLGGAVHGTGKLTTGDKPAYSVSADFEKLNPAAVGQILGQTWRGGSLDANGKIELSGYTAGDLASSSVGTLHFEWRHGSFSSDAAASETVPPALAHFDRWTADAAIASGEITLKQNQVMQSAREHAVAASVTLTEPPKVVFAGARQAQGQTREHEHEEPSR